jgi:hypothetical protein
MWWHRTDYNYGNKLRSDNRWEMAANALDVREIPHVKKLEDVLFP